MKCWCENYDYVCSVCEKEANWELVMQYKKNVLIALGKLLEKDLEEIDIKEYERLSGDLEEFGLGIEHLPHDLI